MVIAFGSVRARRRKEGIGQVFRVATWCHSSPHLKSGLVQEEVFAVLRAANHWRISNPVEGKLGDEEAVDPAKRETGRLLRTPVGP